MKHPLLFLLLSVCALAVPLRADEATSLKGATREWMGQMGAAEARDTVRAYQGFGFRQLSKEQYLRYAAIRGILHGLSAEGDLEALTQ